MSRLARTSFCLRCIAASAAGLAGCQSILGIDSNRPLTQVPGSDAGDGGGQQGDGAAPPPDGGGSSVADAAEEGATADAAEAGAVDAADASAADAGADGAPGTSFTHPIQIDASALFNANSVVTTTVGGMALTAMDGIGTNDNNDFPTQSEVLNLSPTGRGLPDDAFFPSNGATIPNVQLAWRNTVNGPNSIVVSSTSGTVYTFAVPPAPYSQVQLYATGGGGASTLNYSLTYADSSTTPSTLSLPDWCIGTAGSGQYVLASVHRVENGVTFNGGLLCNIYALDLNPDTGKALKSVSFWDTGGSTTYLVFYGATAW